MRSLLSFVATNHCEYIVRRRYLKESNIARVHDWYVQSFEELVHVQPDHLTAQEADEFAAKVTQSASGMLNRHEPTVMSIAVVRLVPNSKIHRNLQV